MKKLTLSLIISIILCLMFTVSANAAEITAKVGTEKYTKIISNTSYSSKTDFKAGTKIEFTSEEEISSIYVVWYETPGEWTLNDNQTVNDGFLKEFVELKTPSKTFSITVKESESMCYIKAFSKDDKVPSDVQKWLPPQDKTDVLMIACHADDETLFLGGAIVDLLAKNPTINIQLISFTNHLASEKFRENERLDAMWALGLRNYPIIGDVPDKYSTTLETGLKTCDYDSEVKNFIGYINKYQPQMIVTQDIDGEYGHGQHMAMVKAVMEAVETLSKEKTYEVSKVYLHLYEENPLTLNLREELDSYDNQTALDVAKAAYKLHQSQQKWSFKVDDEYQHSCAKFGLWKTTVGKDTTNNMFENLVTYTDQEQLAKELKLKEEAEKKAAEEKAAKEAAAKAAAEKKAQMITYAVIAGVALLLLIILIVVISKKRKNNKYVPKHGRYVEELEEDDE